MNEDERAEAVQFSKDHFEKFIVWHGADWYGPIAHVIIHSLKIEVGPYKFDLSRSNEAEILRGEVFAISTANILPLVNGAALHPEAYELTCRIAADLVGSNQPCPEPLRVFISSVLLGKWKSKKSWNYTDLGLPSAKNFLRDMAIVSLIARLEQEFGINATRQLETKNAVSGADVAVQALTELRKEKTKSGHSHISWLPPSVGATNTMWSNRNQFHRMSEVLTLALQEKLVE